MIKRMLFVIFCLVVLVACNGGEAGNEQPEQEGETAVSPTTAPVEEPTAASIVEEVAAAGTTYQLVESEARFTLDEDLRGERVTVVGATDQVNGQIVFDIANPKAAQVSPIEIDAASISTDHNMRNRAMNRFILNTSNFPTITFTPTSLSGIPDSVDLGDSVNFIIDGELGITDITLPVAFEAVVTAVSATRLEGHAATLITRDDFGLSIPEVPGVANVDEQVLLEIEFVAEAN